jgi:hypothetical protein
MARLSGVLAVVHAATAAVEAAEVGQQTRPKGCENRGRAYTSYATVRRYQGRLIRCVTDLLFVTYWGLSCFHGFANTLGEGVRLQLNRWCVVAGAVTTLLAC